LEDAQASTPGGTPPPKPGARGILCRWRGGTGPADFCLPGGKEHGAQRECSLPWKRSFCSSEQDRNKTLSCRVPPATRLLAASIFGSDSLDFSHAPGLYTGAGLGFPDRLRVLPAPDVPGTMSKPKGKPRKSQDGPFSCAGTRSGGEMGFQEVLSGQGWGLSPSCSRRGCGLSGTDLASSPHASAKVVSLGRGCGGVPHGAPEALTASGASTGGAELANYLPPRREGPRSAAEWSAPLETKFLRFCTGQEQDSVLSRSPAPAV
jgi:hypothetical protein